MPSSETTSVEDFYPRPPRGGRLKVQRPRRRNRAISIHALREEGDRLRQPERHEQAISIHALREEGDMCDELMELTDKKFLSTPSSDHASTPGRFLSTPSARRATRLRPRAAFAQKFLSTPSARRATHCGVAGRCAPHYFYPRPPRGGRPRADCRRPTPNTYFYPRPPRGGRLLGPVAPGRTKKFLSTPSARRATQ